MANQVSRKAAMDSGNIVAKKEAQHLTFNELKEQVLGGDETIWRKLQMYSRNMEGKFEEKCPL